MKGCDERFVRFHRQFELSVYAVCQNVWASSYLVASPSDSLAGVDYVGLRRHLPLNWSKRCGWKASSAV